MLAQGYPASGRRGQRGPGLWSRLWCGLWLVAVLMAGPARAAPSCDALPLQPLAPRLWLLPAAGGDSDEANRGQSSHLLVAQEGRRLWVVGTGPTPAFGARLACTLRHRLGVPAGNIDALVPWAHAEVALGTRGLAPRRLWAHAQVAAAMAEQCPNCVDRLRQRLGAAAVDLGDDPVRLPRNLLRGEAGRIGPFDWWVLKRADARVVTVLRHRPSGVMTAPGLLWGDGPPDLRDADVADMQAALERLQTLGSPLTRWVGDSGSLLSAAGLAAQVDYVRALRAAAREGVEQGLVDQEPPASTWATHARHRLNWQRSWRQAEDAWLRGDRP